MGETSTKKTVFNPYADLANGDTVMLSSPLVDPAYWYVGTVLWRDQTEVLVRQAGMAGERAHNQLHDIGDVRVFGTRDYCFGERRKAEALVRDAARLARDVEETSSDLRQKLRLLFESVSTAALENMKAKPRGEASDERS